VYDFLKEIFPGKHISLDTSFKGGIDEPKESFRVNIHKVCKCVNGGIAAANGNTWEAAIYNTFKDLFRNGEVEESCQDQSNQ